jgi:hypothetical protein
MAFPHIQILPAHGHRTRDIYYWAIAANLRLESSRHPGGIAIGRAVAALDGRRKIILTQHKI